MKEEIQTWIKEKVEETGTRGVVVGMSGGLDSSVVAVLCNEVVDTVGIFIPCESNEEDLKDAQSVAEKFKIEGFNVDLNETYGRFLSVLEHSNINYIGILPEKIASANLKSRLRMCTLYYYANSLNRLVVGTTNKTELALGYFTKGGDGCVDIEPISELYKTEVRELAGELGIPKNIIEKPPSAGLWEGQTDEEELGISYEELDRVLKLIESTEHKRQMPEIFKFR